MEKWERELAEIRAIMKESAQENAKGFAEVKELQKKNEEGFARIEKQQEENAKGFARIEKQQEENAKGFAEIRALQERNEEKTEKLNELFDKLGERFKETNLLVNGISDSNGKFSETYFFNTLRHSMKFGGKKFYEIDEGTKRSKKMPDGKHLMGEYDVVMYNGDTVALIEVKHRVRMDHIKELIERQVNVFKQLYGQYANYNFFLGIAGMSFERGVEKAAKENGIGILRPKGESVEILDSDLKVY